MKHFAGIALGLGVILVGLSLSTNLGQGPDAWLIEWTSWAISYVSLAVAAHAVIKLTNSLDTYMKWRCK